MAERRMFTKKITESDAFLDMPTSTQALYFHLNMSADDDGFVNNPKKIQRMVGSADDDMKLLIAKSFIIIFDSGIIVIKHWKMHNYIQNDRYKPTDYIEEKSMLNLKKNKSYTLNISDMDTECIQDVSVGKDRIGKDSIDKNNKEKEQKHKFGEFGHVLLKESESNRLISELGQEIFNKCIKKLDEYIQETGKKYKDHNLTIRRWVIDAVKNDKPKQSIQKNNPKIHNYQERNYTQEDYLTMEQLALSKSNKG